MKRTFILLLPLILIACSATVMRNPTTGQTAQCFAQGPFPLIAQQQCVSGYENQGWVKSDAKELAGLKKQYDDKVARDNAELKACTDKIVTDPSLQILASKIALNGPKNQSLQMLSSKEKPNDQEKVALSSYDVSVKHCRDIYERLSNSMGAPPAILAVNRSTASANDSLLSELYSGSISYGDYAKLRQQIADNREQAVVKITTELQKNAADAQAQSQMIANQTRIAQAQVWQAFSSQQNAIANNRAADAMMIQATKPQKTNINCQSHVIGTTLNTNCY